MGSDPQSLHNSMTAKGWTLSADGSWNPPRTAAAHNLQAGIGEAWSSAERADASKPVGQRGKEGEWEVGKGGVQEQIRKWCDGQWPKWKVIQARSDKPSTIEEGAHDMTVFANRGRVFKVEVKARGGKQSPKQLAWQLELGRIGHKVHVVYSLDEFVRLVTAETD